jgi:hypothetical protein
VQLLLHQLLLVCTQVKHKVVTLAWKQDKVKVRVKVMLRKLAFLAKYEMY